jgi:excisionase family DNA binding protein
MENAAMSDRWLSVEDIAAYLGVSKDTIYAWIANRNMPAHRVGRFWKFQKSEVELWVKAGGANDIKASAKDQ